MDIYEISKKFHKAIKIEIFNDSGVLIIKIISSESYPNTAPSHPLRLLYKTKMDIKNLNSESIMEVISSIFARCTLITNNDYEDSSWFSVPMNGIAVGEVIFENEDDAIRYRKAFHHPNSYHPIEYYNASLMEYDDTTFVYEITQYIPGNTHPIVGTLYREDNIFKFYYFDENDETRKVEIVLECESIYSYATEYRVISITHEIMLKIRSRY